MKVKKGGIEKDIQRCKDECPYFGIDGGPGPVMICKRPDAIRQGYIISHPDCDSGFPRECPLIVGKLPDVEIETVHAEPFTVNDITKWTLKGLHKYLSFAGGQTTWLK